jgi:hypothetical protein
VPRTRATQLADEADWIANRVVKIYGTEEQYRRAIPAQ